MDGKDRGGCGGKVDSNREQGKRDGGIREIYEQMQSNREKEKWSEIGST